jgi:hypothetical protein
MPPNDDIKSFVQNTLGCGCPEEVFNSIDCKENVPLGSNLVLNSVLTIGSRLLIYVVEAASSDFIKKNLALLIANGKKERDSKGLNRLRLVIVAEESLGRQTVQSQFDGLMGKDDKIHLHIISREQSIF